MNENEIAKKLVHIAKELISKDRNFRSSDQFMKAYDDVILDFNRKTKGLKVRQQRRSRPTWEVSNVKEFVDGTEDLSADEFYEASFEFFNDVNPEKPSNSDVALLRSLVSKHLKTDNLEIKHGFFAIAWYDSTRER